MSSLTIRLINDGGVCRLLSAFVEHQMKIFDYSRKARYLFYCMFFSGILSTISPQPAGKFTPNFACGRTPVPNMYFPLLGVGGPRRAEKGGNYIFVTMGVNGEFWHFGGF